MRAPDEAAVDAADHEACTALHHGAEVLAVVEVMLAHGADPRSLCHGSAPRTCAERTRTKHAHGSSKRGSWLQKTYRSKCDENHFLDDHIRSCPRRAPSLLSCRQQNNTYTNWYVIPVY